jgi:hypothetical protein
MRAEYVGKTSQLFHRKLKEFNKRKQAFAETTTVTSKPLFAQFKAAYRIAKCKSFHSIGESLVTCCY